MQVLELRLKMVVEWVIEKKQTIAKLVTSHLPIYRAIKQFIQVYIKHMDDIVVIVERIMKDLHISLTNGNNQTLYQLFDLIRQKELVGIEEWTEKLSILEDRFNQSRTGTNKQFPDIFKDIDANIEYYQQLRTKLRVAAQKSYRTQINPNRSAQNTSRSEQYRPEVAQVERLKNKNIFKTYAEHNIPHVRKTDLYAGLYDKEYSENKQKRTFEPIGRENGKIKISPRHNTAPSELSPFKLVNPKYQIPKQQIHAPIDKYSSVKKQESHSEQINKLLNRHQKYKQYKKYLYEEMRQQMELRTNPKYTAEKYLNQTPPKSRAQESKQYSTSYTDRYQSYRDQQASFQSEGLKYQYWSDNKNKYELGKNNQEEQKSYKKATKKYQYLFDDELYRNQQQGRSRSPKTQIFNQRPLKQKQGNQYKRRNELFGKQNEDSLDKDYLGSQLEVEMPAIFNHDNTNIQELLSSSLMSSKHWGQQQDQYNVGYQPLFQENSEEDSLDDPVQKIRQTGKFKQIQYTDEDEYEYQERPSPKFNFDTPLTIQKQVSSESKDLNMSFGKN